MQKRILQVLGTALIGLALLLGAGVATAEPYTTQITDNSNHDEYSAISGSNLVWQHCDGGTDHFCSGGDWEIYFWDGVSITQLTDNSDHDRYPAISGSNVVWMGDDGSDYEIYLWDGHTTTQITNNGIYDTSPAISGSNLVWVGDDGNDNEIYF